MIGGGDVDADAVICNISNRIRILILILDMFLQVVLMHLLNMVIILYPHIR
jgi:hypothetical protein